MGIWLSNQRSAKAKNSLSADREKKLNETGMVWRVSLTTCGSGISGWRSATAQSMGI
ncbi:helicase associated domain-containing protein [uncultured Oscillibacter sp.]|uniref:helicase associated domain-containing protein n=1 Tax=uncultured Oscillibacter sp. TaxID=876091 RepID=UPI002630CA44|nr:helicase associated domain-containing protein [uncultured Oscillibacter sp.]